MRFETLALTFAISTALPAAATAGEQGFFAGLDMLGGVAFGSSSTRDGGGILPLFAGDGVVSNVRFGETIGFGGHVGYWFNPSWSATVSYQHILGDVSWDAAFPNYGGGSKFDGNATSDAIIGDIAYERPLSDATVVSLKAGLGVGFNRLSRLVERDMATGAFVSNVAGKTKISPIAQIGAGARHKLIGNTTIGLDASLAYAGSFETGNTRSGNLGVTSINPYRIDDVWRASLGASIGFKF